MPTKIHIGPAIRQKNSTSSAVSPVAWKAETMAPRKAKSSTQETSTEMPAKIAASVRPRRIRSKRPAPQFWPRIGPTAPESAKSTPKATGTSRSMIASAATAVSPKRATTPAKTAFAIGFERLVRIAGPAIAKVRALSCRMSGRRGRSIMPCTTTQPWKPIAQMMIRASTIAIAAPSGPSPKPKIRSGSSPAVTMPPPSVTNIARRASPMARRMPEKPMPIAIRALDGSTM